MITKFMTEVRARFNPFSGCAKPARLFLSLVPPAARRAGTKTSATLLPRGSGEASSLMVKFSKSQTSPPPPSTQPVPGRFLTGCTDDGKEMTFDCSKTTIKGLVEEVDRHSRQLQKAADLMD